MYFALKIRFQTLYFKVFLGLIGSVLRKTNVILYCGTCHLLSGKPHCCCFLFKVPLSMTLSAVIDQGTCQK